MSEGEKSEDEMSVSQEVLFKPFQSPLLLRLQKGQNGYYEIIQVSHMVCYRVHRVSIFLEGKAVAHFASILKGTLKVFHMTPKPAN